MRSGADFAALARDLCDRVELPKRFQFVAEKFQPYRPRTGERVNIENAAAQRKFALAADFRFRLVALILQPLDEINRFDAVATPERARARRDFARWKRALHERSDSGKEDRSGKGSVWRMRPGVWSL